MSRRSFPVFLILLVTVTGPVPGGLPGDCRAGTRAGGDELKAGRPAITDSTVTESESPGNSWDRNRLLLHPVRYDPEATTLTFSVRRNQTANRLLGYEYYRASKMQCTMDGAGLGASLGLMLGAFGEMTGAWNEKTSWALGGAMAAMGAFYGGKMKADDPGWYLRVRWDDKERPEPLE
ncbi:MAG TPA: hypothetical protein VLA34_13555 [Candidatus Krumholzibacterium sp.]|nr:hypothetical protein [Candidatus Krumholzibacterium sp.]